MSLKADKFYFDDIFSRLWTQTPIHFAGQEFDAAGIDQWINPTFSPSRSEFGSLSNFSEKIYSNLYIPCWAENDVDIMELMDDVIAFIKANVKQPYVIRSVSIIDHGWDGSNKVFGIIMFAIESRNGICAKPVTTTKCATSVGENTGLPYILGNTWQPNCPMFKKV